MQQHRVKFCKTIHNAEERRRRLSLLFQIFEQKKTLSDDSLPAGSLSVDGSKNDSSSVFTLHPHFTTPQDSFQPSNLGNLAKNPSPTLDGFFDDGNPGQVRMFDMDFGDDV